MRNFLVISSLDSTFIIQCNLILFSDNHNFFLKNISWIIFSGVFGSLKQSPHNSEEQFDSLKKVIYSNWRSPYSKVKECENCPTQLDGKNFSFCSHASGKFVVDCYMLLKALYIFRLRFFFIKPTKIFLLKINIFPHRNWTKIWVDIFYSITISSKVTVFVIFLSVIEFPSFQFDSNIAIFSSLINFSWWNTDSIFMTMSLSGWA